jgi:hypothetical protein
MKLTKRVLRKLIKEELIKEIKQYPDQPLVYLKFKIAHDSTGVPSGQDYYVEVPTTFIHGKSATDRHWRRHGRSRRTSGWNGLTEAGKKYFETFEGGKFANLATSFLAGGITWTAVPESGLPQIFELEEIAEPRRAVGAGGYYDPDEDPYEDEPVPEDDLD